jgi:hypothetical protein
MLTRGHLFSAQDLNADFRNGPSSPYTQDGQPWDRRFHLILNLAVGGSYFPSGQFGPFDTQADWDAAVASWSQPRMEVDYVKVWGPNN